MKKNIKIMIGFPIGITVLILTYVLIGIVDGAEIYSSEIMKLTDYKYLLMQTVLSGISYLIVVYVVNFLKEFFKKVNTKEKHTYKDLWNYLVMLIATFLAAFIISEVLDRKGTLQGHVGEIFMGITVLGMIVTGIGIAVYNVIDTIKINKALRKRQEEK